jgi:hypothetical protein
MGVAVGDVVVRVGVYVLPANDSDGKPFLNPGEKPIRVIDPRKGIATARGLIFRA